MQTARRIEKKRTRLALTISRWQRQLRTQQSWRLAFGFAYFLSMVPGALSHHPTVEWFYPVPFFIGFLFLIFRTRALSAFVARLQRYEMFLQRQWLRSLGRPSGQAWEAALKESVGLPLVRDIGLLGAHSLWTLIDETLSDGGRRQLLHWLTSPVLDTLALSQRQSLVRELRRDTWFYTRLIVDTGRDDLNFSTVQIDEFLRTRGVPSGFSRALALNLFVWFGTIATALACDFAGRPLPAWVLVIFPLVSLASLRAGSGAFRAGVGLAHHLAALTPLFRAIERRAMGDGRAAGGGGRAVLARTCPEICAARPSRSARRLDFVMNFVGTQTNPILHFVLNAFLPWTVVAAYVFERLRVKISRDFPRCLAELQEFEVLGSLLVLARFQTETFPELTAMGAGAGAGSTSDARPRLLCEQIFHPLLERERAVANDFAFADGKSLGLLTGSNMSGKSTFLRTIGINQVLANMGAPVFARRFVTTPMRIESCIEVTDSLRDGYSYFYAEVRKLRHILEVTASGAPTLYLIDEIFRGTNNHERQVGSRAVIRTLAGATNALGFVSTHDLELTALENTCPSVINLHFREDLTAAGAMVFHYHLNRGPSPTTNALIIMRAEGIPVEE